MPQLTGKTAIITGAGTGIGRGIVRGLAAEGARLVLAGRTATTLQSAADEVAAAGGEAHVVPTDVTDEAQVAALFQQALELTGQVDILINNAGVFDGGPIEELSLDTWQKVIGVNLTGPFLCTREAMKIMKPQRSGRIINIGSISAQMPRMNSVPYSTSKHGLVGLTKAAALEGREHGVVVSCIHPGNVMADWRQDNNSMNEEPMMSADELAVAIVTMAIMPPHVNMLEAIVLPTTQKYLGRG